MSPARIPVPRKFGRVLISCDAMLAFPARHSHPRIKAHLFQIGQGGCALSTKECLFIGEECLVWACFGGQKALGAQGTVVWTKTVYEGHEMTLVGIEFKKTIELATELLARLKGPK